MGCKETIRLTRLVLLEILLSSVNLVLSFVNVDYFLESQETAKYGYYSLFLMWFPGLVTSGGFLVLYFRGVRAVSSLQPWKLVLYPLALLFCFPVLPVLLTVAYLVKRDEKLYEKAILARFFSSFLDHGPQFVLRVVVVVLNGLSHRGQYNRDDYLFILSMIASFMSLVFSALHFNERKASFGVRLFISIPMFSAIFACRAFTLAVFLREVLQEGSAFYLRFLWIIVILALILGNLAIFRWCGQDWIRSLVYGCCSILLPAGYGNDNLYYQLPNQNLLQDQDHAKPKPRLRRDLSLENRLEGVSDEVLKEAEDQEAEGDSTVHLKPMKSGRYLMTHSVMNTIVLGLCFIYLYTNNKLDKEADEALVIPQILAVIPGLLFAGARSILHDDFCPTYSDDVTVGERASGCCQRGCKVFLSVVLATVGYCSLVPSLFWTLIYKYF